jgi:hypothetical protein
MRWVRRDMVRRRATFTTDPDSPAPDLHCPTCDRSLVYRETVVNGVNPPERWDYLECRMCGPFEYRHRTGKLRPTAELPFRLTHHNSIGG